MRWPLCAEEDAYPNARVPHGCGIQLLLLQRGLTALGILEAAKRGASTRGQLPPASSPVPPQPLEPECAPGRAHVALPLALQAAARACCAPRDCHPLLSNKTIFSPLCFKPLVIIYLECAPALALTHASGNGKPRASMCLPDPCPAFAQL